MQRCPVNPVDSVDDLLCLDVQRTYPRFIFHGLPLNRSRTPNAASPLPSPQSVPEQRPEFLLCHDFKNNYRSDRFVFEERAGLFEMASLSLSSKKELALGDDFWIPTEVLRSGLITEFCYFSHHFISIPPTSWINLCHRHGVKVYGTFITEWAAGKQVCERVFLQDSDAVVRKLAEIQEHFNFDGWLVNIENDVKVGQQTESETEVDTERDNATMIPEILDFLRSLKHHTEVVTGRASKIIWYDSITSPNGELAWQNRVCGKNRCFLEATDAIFLNYWWSDEGLSHSRHECSLVNQARSFPHSTSSPALPLGPPPASSHSSESVYVGIDCFAPRTEENKKRQWPLGGWDCGQVAERARRVDNRLSIALFAPGWLVESELPGRGTQGKPIDAIESYKVHVQFWQQFEPSSSLVASHARDPLPKHADSQMARDRFADFSSDRHTIIGIPMLLLTLRTKQRARRCRRRRCRRTRRRSHTRTPDHGSDGTAGSDTRATNGRNMNVSTNMNSNTSMITKDAESARNATTYTNQPHASTNNEKVPAAFRALTSNNRQSLKPPAQREAYIISEATATPITTVMHIALDMTASSPMLAEQNLLVWTRQHRRPHQHTRRRIATRRRGIKNKNKRSRNKNKNKRNRKTSGSRSPWTEFWRTDTPREATFRVLATFPRAGQEAVELEVFTDRYFCLCPRAWGTPDSVTIQVTHQPGVSSGCKKNSH